MDGRVLMYYLIHIILIHVCILLHLYINKFYRNLFTYQAQVQPFPLHTFTIALKSYVFICAAYYL